MKDDKLLNIEDVINILSEIKEEHGNLPFYLMYDDYVYIHIDRIEIVEESESYHHNPIIYPRRVVCMGGVDSQMYTAD